MSKNGLPLNEEKLEAWRAEVARGNEEARLRPRPSIRNIGASALTTEKPATVPIEEPDQPSPGNQSAPTVRKSDSMPRQF